MRDRTVAQITAGLFAVAILLLAASQALEGAGTQPVRFGRAVHDVRPASTYIDARVLAANTAETVTIPTFAAAVRSRAVVVWFSATCENWYYNTTATAAVPAADVTDGGAAGRAPDEPLRFAQAATFSIVADATCVVTMEMGLE